MPKTILLTSFDVWETHHISNSSDDLVEMAIAHHWLPPNVQVLRRLPVDWQLAPIRVIAAIAEWQPDVIICCGMAEQRLALTVEANGKCQGDILTTGIALSALMAATIATHISHDAGNFVCNHLYYSVLQHIQTTSPSQQCLFIHVPRLHDRNWASVGQDFAAIVHTLAR
jgi:pyroglutamyl-peptidase